MATHQAPPSLGFSRQEHWSGFPFPSPMHESEKWKWSRSVTSDSSRHHGLQSTRFLHPWDFLGKSTGVGCHCLLELLRGYSRKHQYQFSLSPIQLFVTPWITAHQTSLSITTSRSSLKFTSIKLVMPSNHLILCHPLLLLPSIPPSIRVFSNESTLHIRWPKYWRFSFSIIASK